jgi:hypothetical protein
VLIHAWPAGRAAQLYGRQLLLATAVEGALGLVMIGLKDLVLIHLHLVSLIRLAGTSRALASWYRLTPSA